MATFFVEFGGDDVDVDVGDDVVLMTMTMMLTTHCKGAASFYAKW